MKRGAFDRGGTAGGRRRPSPFDGRDRGDAVPPWFGSGLRHAGLCRPQILGQRPLLFQPFAGRTPISRRCKASGTRPSRCQWRSRPVRGRARRGRLSRSPPWVARKFGCPMRHAVENTELRSLSPLRRGGQSPNRDHPERLGARWRRMTGVGHWYADAEGDVCNLRLKALAFSPAACRAYGFDRGQRGSGAGRGSRLPGDHRFTNRSSSGAGAVLRLRKPSPSQRRAERSHETGNRSTWSHLAQSRGAAGAVIDRARRASLKLWAWRRIMPLAVKEPPFFSEAHSDCRGCRPWEQLPCGLSRNQT